MIRKQPCAACPYRLDVPSGVWVVEEYAKLVDYDKPTAEQPWWPFRCHATPEHYCHGWAVVHNNRGQPYELLALRLFARDERVPAAKVPLFASGAEAAEHGLRDVKRPKRAARAMMERLLGRHARLHTK